MENRLDQKSRELGFSLVNLCCSWSLTIHSVYVTIKEHNELVRQLNFLTAFSKRRRQRFKDDEQGNDNCEGSSMKKRYLQ